MSRGKNIDLRKKNNRNLILNIIKNNQYVSRSTVKTISKLSMTTVLNTIEELLKNGLIYEAGTGESTGGRKPIWLKINPDGAYFIGAEFNANDVTGAILNLKGEIVYTNKIVIKGKLSKELIMNEVKNCVQDLMNQLEGKRNRIVGIGLGVPGFVDKKRGISINYVHVPEWRNIPIKDEIEKEWGIKTYIETNVKAMALAFKWYKQDMSSRNILFISIRTGVGMGCILNNEVYNGRNNASGEIGHIFVKENGIKCKCGKYGCLDTEVGYSAIKKKIIAGLKEGKFRIVNEIIDGNIDKLDIDVFVESIERDDEDSVLLLKETCKLIGRAVGYAITLLNPDEVIFSGEISYAKNFISYIKDEIDKNCLEESRKGLIVRVNDFGDRIGGIGAAAIVMQEEFGFTTKPI